MSLKGTSQVVSIEKRSTFRESYDWERAKLLGVGNFGCVVQMPLNSSPEANSRYHGESVLAVKFQLGSSNDPRLLNEYEAALLAGKSRSVLHAFNLPYLFGAYRMKINRPVGGDYDEDRELYHIRILCKEIADQMDNYDNSQSPPILQVLEMEFIHGRTLQSTLQYMHSKQISPNKEDIAHLALQILCALYTLATDHRMSHMDLKASNIILSRTESEGLRRRFKIGTDSWTFSSDRDNIMRRVPFIIDFGLAVMWDKPGDRRDSFLYVSSPIRYLIQNPENYGDVAGDLWSVAILIINTALVSYQLPKRVTNALREMNGAPFDILSFDSPVILALKNEKLADYLYRLIGNQQGKNSKGEEEGGYELETEQSVPTDPLSLKRWKITAVAGACLMHKAFCGDFLPRLPPKNQQFNSVYDKLKAAEKEIIEQSKIDGVDVFALLFARVESVVGQSGILLVQDLFKWHDWERARDLKGRAMHTILNTLIQRSMARSFFDDWRDSSTTTYGYPY